MACSAPATPARSTASRPIRPRTRTTSPRCSTRSSRRAGATCAGAATARSPLETRSGNTLAPRQDLERAGRRRRSRRSSATAACGRIASPDGRYLQVRASFGGAHTVLRDLTVYYQPQNQRPRVTEITVGDETPAQATSRRSRAAASRARRWSSCAGSVDNPDDDELIYRLYFREESEANWKPIGGPEPLTRTEYDWNTESIPDGNYVVKVVASDERSNPREEALEHSLTSTPFLVDNRKPELAELKVAYPMRVAAARTTASRPSPSWPTRSTAATGSRSRPRTASSTIPTEDFSVKLPTRPRRRRPLARGARRRRRRQRRRRAAHLPRQVGITSRAAARASSLILRSHYF